MLSLASFRFCETQYLHLTTCVFGHSVISPFLGGRGGNEDRSVWCEWSVVYKLHRGGNWYREYQSLTKKKSKNSEGETVTPSPERSRGQVFLWRVTLLDFVYGLASASRIDKIILQKRPIKETIFCKRTYNLIDPTKCRHPIVRCRATFLKFGPRILTGILNCNGRGDTFFLSFFLSGPSRGWNSYVSNFG